MKRSMIFIDSGNLSKGFSKYCSKQLDNNFKRKISYPKLINELKEDNDLIRTYFYDAVENPIPSKKHRFFDMLRSNEVTIVTKELRYKSNSCSFCNKTREKIPYQKGVDVSLVTDTMSLAFEKAYEIAIIVSGDNDFVDAVNFIKSKGLKVWIVSFKNCLGEDIRRSADRVIILDSIFEKIVF